jgi:hypothetical protein
VRIVYCSPLPLSCHEPTRTPEHRALIYQHATAEADRAIAQAVSDAVKAERKKARKAADGKAGKPKRPAAGKPEKKAGKAKKPGKRKASDPDDGMAGGVARRG